jgi:hypothetical protein
VSELETITGEAQIDPSPPPQEPSPLPAERGQLERYRRALANLLMRGEKFVTTTPDPILGAWAFAYLIRLLEDLAAHQVQIDGQTEPLMPHAQTSAIRLELLERYLGRGEHDPLCLATARAHLAAAIREQHRYTVRTPTIASTARC